LVAIVPRSARRIASTQLTADVIGGPDEPQHDATIAARRDPRLRRRMVAHA